MLRTRQASEAKLFILPALWISGLLNFACGGTADSGDASPADADTDNTADFMDSDVPGPDTFVVFDPEDGRWGLGGTLVISEGIIDLEATLLTLEIQSDDGNCELEASLTKGDIVTEPPEEALGWWDLTLSPAADPTCPWRGPDNIQIGFQVPSPDIDPAAARADLRTDTTYGLVLMVTADPRLVGLSGTEEQFMGSAQRVEVPPVLDGSYQLETLFGTLL